MTTATMTAVLNTIKSHLLSFTSAGGGSTLATLLGSTTSGSGSDGKLFLNQAPDNLTGFWAILKIQDAPQQGFDGGMMIRGQAELIFYAQGRRNQAAIERMADLVTEAWHLWAYDASGHISAMHITSRFPIPYLDPADRELIAVRLLLPFRCVPTFLSQYAAT
jgi:hypothetical protein